MDRSTPIELITIAYNPDSFGQQIATETPRTVFANVRSVSRQEWYDGGQNGLKPQYQATMFAPDYNGETIVSYNDTRYGVYRTYLRADEMIELYLESKAGI